MELDLVKTLASVPVEKLVIAGQAWLIFHLMRHNRGLTAGIGLLARSIGRDDLDPTRGDLITPDQPKKGHP